MKIEERGMYQTYILGSWGHLLRISISSAAILKHYMKGTFSSCKNRFSLAKVEYTIELAFFIPCSIKQKPSLARKNRYI
jgi:hypothetical protein